MMSCKEATKLVSEAQDRELSVGERATLRLHLTICTGCRRFETQMDLIRRACQRLTRGEAPIDDRDR
jgi:putative zinc finger protein